MCLDDLTASIGGEERGHEQGRLPSNRVLSGVLRARSNLEEKNTFQQQYHPIEAFCTLDRLIGYGRAVC